MSERMSEWMSGRMSMKMRMSGRMSGRAKVSMSARMRMRVRVTIRGDKSEDEGGVEDGQMHTCYSSTRLWPSPSHALGCCFSNYKQCIHTLSLTHSHTHTLTRIY